MPTGKSQKSSSVKKSSVKKSNPAKKAVKTPKPKSSPKSAPVRKAPSKPAKAPPAPKAPQKPAKEAATPLKKVFRKDQGAKIMNFTFTKGERQMIRAKAIEFAGGSLSNLVRQAISAYPKAAVISAA